MQSSKSQPGQVAAAITAASTAHTPVSPPAMAHGHEGEEPDTVTWPAHLFGPIVTKQADGSETATDPS